MNDPYHMCDRGEREAQYDGYGIFLTYTCPKCHKAKLATFRPDISERYDTDEAIEAD